MRFAGSILRMAVKAIARRCSRGAIYKSHSHDIDEECLVIEGDLRYGDFVLRAGDYHVAAPGTHHPAGTTAAGCLLHVVVGMDI